jgi:hypothetical protein
VFGLAACAFALCRSPLEIRLAVASGLDASARVTADAARDWTLFEGRIGFAASDEASASYEGEKSSGRDAKYL